MLIVRCKNCDFHLCYTPRFFKWCLREISTALKLDLPQCNSHLIVLNYMSDFGALVVWTSQQLSSTENNRHHFEVSSPIVSYLQIEISIEKYWDDVINMIATEWETKNFAFEDVHVTGERTIAEIANRMLQLYLVVSRCQKFVKIRSKIMWWLKKIKCMTSTWSQSIWILTTTTLMYLDREQLT